MILAVCKAHRVHSHIWIDAFGKCECACYVFSTVKLCYATYLILVYSTLGRFGDVAVAVSSRR